MGRADSTSGRSDLHSCRLRLSAVRPCAPINRLSLLTPRENREDDVLPEASFKFIPYWSTPHCVVTLVLQVMFVVSLALLSTVCSLCTATTEWWGDLRAHLNPARQAPFYDVTYDEKVNVCPQGLHADAIPEYVYFGTMLATMTVDEHDQCLQKCAEKPRCKAVNFFHPFAYQEKGFCELLTEGQRDNPSLMRPFRKATYYEKIRCRELDDVEDVEETVAASEITEKVPEDVVREKKLDISKLMKKLSAKVKEFNGASGGFRAAR